MFRSHRAFSATIAFFIVLAPGLSAFAATHTVTSNGDASVSQSTDGRSWIVGNNSIEVSVRIDSRTGLRVDSLVNAVTSSDWIILPGADTHLTTASGSVVLGATGSPFAYQSASATSPNGGVELAISFSAPAIGLKATRHYACFPGAPVIETWTTFEGTSSGRGADVANLNAWQLTVSGQQVSWLTGLQPDLMGSSAEPFTLQRQLLSDGQTLALGAAARSSESALPYFVLENGDERLFGGLEWSGAWSLTMTGSAGGTAIAIGLPAMSTRLNAGMTIDGPRGFFGVTSGSASDVAAAMRTFVSEALRGGRLFPSLVTSNTWFANGVAIDAASMTAEIDAAAALGAEAFVLDAGYYPGADANDPWDFTSGLGTWTWDTARFPDGLATLAQHAHDLGLKFGLWVEPERVDLSTVGQPGLAQASFLAKQDGLYDPASSNGEAHAAQICLGSTAARAWLVDRLSRLIDAVQPDYLKWDNNFWINCNDPSHGHQTTDGNFRQIVGLYAVLSELRSRYPDLIIENCSGGGHRIDFGMLRYTDVGWMDDRTSPAPLVRHNLEGLLEIVPPSYLFSFVIDSDANPSDGRLDVPLMFRSRMPGVLGLGFSGVSLSDEIKTEARQEIAIYKSIRDLQVSAHGTALSAPANGPDAPEWDSMQEVDATSGDAVVFAFQADPAAPRTSLVPLGLTSNATYRVDSPDAGYIGTATGADLMADGIEINASPTTSAHVLILRVQSVVPASK